MDTKKVQQTFSDFYNAFNEFMQWVADKPEHTGIDGTELPDDYEVSFYPEIDEIADIIRQLESHSDMFSVPFVTGETLRQSFKNDTGFYCRGYRISPFVWTGNILKSGFDLERDGDTVMAYVFEDFGEYDNGFSLIDKGVDWEEVAEAIMAEIEE